MKLLFLNAWGGTVKPLIHDFIKEKSIDTDIFCFQEAFENNEWLFKDQLSNFNHISDFKYFGPNDEYYQSTYLNKSIKTNAIETIFQNEPDTGLCLFTSLLVNNKPLNLCNVHGIWKPGNKLDTPGRLKQSSQIIDFLKNVTGPKIIGGDFNLEFDSQSVKMFEDNGYVNLIKKYNISTTRNNLSWARFPNNKQYFADYVFVSPDINVLNFSVPNIEVSDHLPLILEIK
jgi:endonuclease/exonuclease/phosphatase (EEP) superfamily protein YafD